MCWFLHQWSWLCSISQFDIHFLCGDPKSQRVAFLVVYSLPRLGISRNQLVVFLLISEWLAISRRHIVVFLVASLFPNLIVRGIVLFQTTTTLWHSNLHRAITATAHMVNYHTLSIVCSKKSKPVGLCLLSRGGRAICSQIIHHSQQSRVTISS